MSDKTPLQVGDIVLHPKCPHWGPGRVLNIRGPKVTVFFRDIPTERRDDGVRTIDTARVPLTPSPDTTDPVLQNLPRFIDGKFQVVHPRVTLEEGIECFRSRCPQLFNDPLYIGDDRVGERAYKLEAHERFVQLLGTHQLADLLRGGQLKEARGRLLSVESKLNLLSVYEKSAFRHALKDDKSAERYLSALNGVLDSDSIEESSYGQLLEAVDSLPSEKGKTPPAKWTIATLMPFIAQPERHMFLKPEVTKDCADRIRFELNYRTDLNWLTYSKLLEMSQYLLGRLRQYGARDYIDVQSFIWLIGAGWENA